MTDDRKVSVTDKRRSSRPEPAPGEAVPSGGQTVFEPPSGKTSPSAGSTGGEKDVPSGGRLDEDAPAAAGSPDAPAKAEHDFLADLQRVQADFDNYRKRMMRQQTQMAEQASARLVERLLPVLDNFDAAISHGEGGSGVEMAYNELRRVLEDEGLKEIDALDKPFDPRVHEAFEAREDDSVSEPVVVKVLRPGYQIKERVVRPAMVSVARPADTASSDDAAEG